MIFLIGDSLLSIYSICFFPFNTFFNFPADINTASRIRLIQQGTSKILKPKKYETAITLIITSNIARETLRKYLNSFFDKGFSGVSRGQKTNMQTADTALTTSRAV